MTYRGADISAGFDFIDVDVVVMRAWRAELSTIDSHGSVSASLRTREGRNWAAKHVCLWGH